MPRISKAPEVRAALPGTQAEIAERTGIPQNTVSCILRKMEASREVSASGNKRPHVYALVTGPVAPVDVADDDDADDTEATARDLEKSRAWLKDWRPSRDPMVAAMFGPGVVATGEKPRQRLPESASSY